MDRYQVRLRGTTTLNDNDPLYVIDGIPIANGVCKKLTVDDIESIQVLRDVLPQLLFTAHELPPGLLLSLPKRVKKEHRELTLTLQHPYNIIIVN